MPSQIILCHKCAGLLTPNDTTAPLYSCGCMSGYVREFQSAADHINPVDEQISECLARIDLYKSQGRTEAHWIDDQQMIIDRLRAYKEKTHRT